MAEDAGVKEAVARLERAVAALEEAAERRLEREQDYGEAEAEVQLASASRSARASELSSSWASRERSADANKEVSRRLVTAMETIRAVLDR